LNIPLAVRGVCFAKQAPQSGVQPHSDGRNFILTTHLGIQIPTTTKTTTTTNINNTNIHQDDNNTMITKPEEKEDEEKYDEHNNSASSSSCCWIQVGTERRTWQRGKLLTLDTSFIHSTGNDSPDQERHVLIIDFWHPELTQPEREALTFIYNLRNQFERGVIPFRQPNHPTMWQQQQRQQQRQQQPTKRSMVEEEKQKQQDSSSVQKATGLSTWWKNLVGGNTTGSDD
jgi:hypothetical protein